MRIDVHTHYVPQAFWHSIAASGAWYGATVSQANGREFVTSGPRRAGPVTAEWRFTAEERIKLVYPVKVRITGDPNFELKPGIPADVTLLGGGA